MVIHLVGICSYFDIKTHEIPTALSRDTAHSNAKVQRYDKAEYEDRLETAQLIGDISQNQIDIEWTPKVRDAEATKAQAEIATRSDFARSRLLMPLVFAAAMGGNLSLIGAPGNLIAQGVLEQGTGLKFGFFEYAKVGFPILIIGIIYCAFIGYRFLPNHSNLSMEDSIYNSSKNDQNVPAWKQNLSLIILIGTLIAMVFEDAIGVRLYISACIGALLLIVCRVITEKQAYKSIDSQVIFLFGGTLALATALKDTGAGADIANTIIGMLGDNPDPFILLVTIFIISCVLTNFMSNTATTALLAPICLSIANTLGADPRAVLMATVIGASCAYATPIGMPANTMVLSVGGYKFMDYVKAGVPLIIISTVVGLILLPIFFPFFPE